MKKRVILSLAAALVAVPAALLAAKKWQQLPEAEEPEQDEDMREETTRSFPLKNKYADYSRGQDDPQYLFELETPEGVKEFPVTLAHYETYYIGDEVICIERDGRWTVA